MTIKYTPDHEWLQINADGTATVGITHHAQDAWAMWCSWTCPPWRHICPRTWPVWSSPSRLLLTSTCP